MQQIKEFLDEKVAKYNQPDFIEMDPIAVPHRFSKKEDIEIAAFFSATIAWGNRKSILKSANQLLSWMDNSPSDFILNATEKDLSPFNNFKYRTFNGTDCLFFIKSLQNIYTYHGGLENIFTNGYLLNESVKTSIINFKDIFFSIPFNDRTKKHVANPYSGSAAKRINMFLRWMVRKDSNGVDFGLWNNISMKNLMIPLDVHSGNIARQLQLLTRKQNDWRAVEELTNKLKKFDVNDPVKYDFALFGIGVNKDY